MRDKLNILVVGESCLDRFVYCKCDRIAPDGPWPVIVPSITKENDGLAANCFQNLKAFAKDHNVFFCGPKSSIIKTRYLDIKTNHCFIRVDENDKVDEFDRCSIYDYLRNINLTVKDLDALVISDYNKGFLSKDIINHLAGLARLNKVPVFLDTKFALGPWSEEIDFIKINEKEYNESAKIYPRPEKYCQNLIVTLGKLGATMPKLNKSFPLKTHKDVHDTTGCGDTFMAALVYSYLIHNKDIFKAIEDANLAASHKASLKGIVYFDFEEIDS